MLAYVREAVGSLSPEVATSLEHAFVFTDELSRPWLLELRALLFAAVTALAPLTSALAARN